MAIAVELHRVPDLHHAPWTDDEVKNLTAWQEAGFVHPFTSAEGEDLIATRDGWVTREGGPVVQTWAHRFMTDGSGIAWRQQAVDALAAVKLPET